MHLKNSNFMRIAQAFIAEATFLAFRQMDDICQGHRDLVNLPNRTQMAGFYIRTKVQVWNRNGRRVYRIPRWERRYQLAGSLMVGDSNCYVMRSNHKETFDLYLLYRGTSNEFNAIPQYGASMRNVQLFRKPQYDPLTNKIHKGGSVTVPLFYYYYCDIIRDLWPHVMKALEWLGWDDERCRRIVVTGHSMGAALTTTSCYMFKHMAPLIWDKMQFRTFASPLCCNNVAVQQMEQAIIDSAVPNKFIESVNTDDFVNIQYLLAGRKQVRKAVERGTTKLGSWLMEEMRQNSVKDERQVGLMERFGRIIQLQPEVAVSAFMLGAVDTQIGSASNDRSAGFRMGQRAEETKMWGSFDLRQTYNNTFKLIWCNRRPDWRSEYVGKSHVHYFGINMAPVWAPLRQYEDYFYRQLAEHGLRKDMNHTRVVALVPPEDIKHVAPLLRDYEPEPYVPPTLKIIGDLGLQSQVQAEHAEHKRTGRKKPKKFRLNLEL